MTYALRSVLCLAQYAGRTFRLLPPRLCGLQQSLYRFFFSTSLPLACLHKDYHLSILRLSSERLKALLVRIWHNLSLALEIGARAEQGDALVHDGLADPEVVFKPLQGTGVFAERIWLKTGCEAS